MCVSPFGTVACNIDFEEKENQMKSKYLQIFLKVGIERRLAGEGPFKLRSEHREWSLARLRVLVWIRIHQSCKEINNNKTSI